MKMKNGYTLAELLIAIVVLLVVVCLFVSTLFYKKDNEDTDINTTNVIRQQQERGNMYFSDKNCKVESIDITGNSLSIKCKI